MEDNVFAVLGKQMFEGYKEEDFTDLIDAIKGVQDKVLGADVEDFNEDGEEALAPDEEEDADKKKMLRERSGKDISLRTFTIG